MADTRTPEQRSRIMAAVRSRDTSPELALRRGLFAAGVRGWRCHRTDLPGRPDISFGRAKLAVFVDGAFWHGHPDHYWGQSGAFWDEKIERNRLRDREVDRQLRALEWTVVRLWDFEIDRDLPGCVARVRAGLKEGSLQRETK